MAGIGFEIRKILHKDNLTSTLAAYSYAGLIGSGPLILSIVSIQLISLFSLSVARTNFPIVQFQVSLTYLIAASQILTGAVQLMFTRYISDRLFGNENETVLPSYHAVLLVVTLGAGILGLILCFTAFAGMDIDYRLLMLTAFVLLCNIWCGIIFLSGIKQYRAILLLFVVGYGSAVIFALFLFPRFGLNGLIGSFVLGHILLILGMHALIYRNFRSEKYISWQVFDRRFNYPRLGVVGLCYYLGEWLHKIQFWYYPFTGQPVIGPLHASFIYDYPIFLSYLAVLPGMAFFLLRIETDFVEYYNAFYDAVRSGGTYEHLQNMRNMMVRGVRTGLYEVLKIQSIVVLLVFAFGQDLLHLVGISVYYLPLLRIDTISASLQVLFLVAINVFLYIDRQRVVMILSVLFVVLTGLFTWVTLKIGPETYGYGFALSSFVVVLMAIFYLEQYFSELEYETYMLHQDELVYSHN
ncbi:MAG: exopolysaccharide Pel transporter PelG [Ferrovum myxofaciens]|uniref:exopolysaccharide Pel transporter PelG n=1 Tax=Ferrovum myxofaciens TaxID=416213 RepID=UPI002357CD32|nr:exopolysaccharide Pel transporter PelG [Ferrovum myxofaciens]QKE40823.1 MAG: exopolysaccharide Pel transporter PelG [Ferrovum myxofaciens]